MRATYSRKEFGRRMTNLISTGLRQTGQQAQSGVITLPAGEYTPGTLFVVPEGITLAGVGRPTIKGAVYLEPGSGLVGIDIDATGKSRGVVVGDDALIEDVRVSGATSHGVLMHGSGARWFGGRVADCGENGFAFRTGARYNTVDGVLIEGNNSFGVHMDEASNNNRILRCRGTNRLELVGIRFSCYANLVSENIAEGTQDNGISVTGYKNIVTVNTCRGNAHSGIGVYGHRNVVNGNILEDNNQAGNPAFASIFVKPDFNGLGRDNAIVGNVCLDTIGVHLRVGAVGNVVRGNVGVVTDVSGQSNDIG